MNVPGRRPALAVLASLAYALATPAGATTATGATATGAAVRVDAPLHGAPFAAFKDRDREIFLATVTTLVTARADGDQLRWANDATGAWGKMTLHRTWRAKRSRCREVRGDNTAGGRTDAFRVVMCTAGKDAWKVRTSGPAPRR